jgi:flavodoxin/ferredoxin
VKAVVLYYSQTGNTKKVAQAIHRGMRRAVPDCELKTIKEVDPASLGGYDLLGLGSPVWMGGETPNVRRFLDRVPKQAGTHLFSFCTHGVMPEHYFPSLVRRLDAKGFTVIGTWDCYGAVHFQLAPVPYWTDGHPDQVDLKGAEAFGREMAARSLRVAAGETDLVPPFPEHAYTPQLHVLLDFFQSGHNPHGTIRFDREKCLYPKCTRCRDHCLMGYIDLDADPPRHGSKGDGCDMWMGCTFCELICPTGAISGPWEEIAAAMARGETPAVILGYNPLAKAAEGAAASGRLRPLVPPGEVGSKGPYFKAFNNRPRFRVPKGGG